jgi:chromosome condensin MukBEF ATPase and DNA-binding subunit MukB
MTISAGPIFEGDTKPEPTPIAALRKALEKVEYRIDESKGTIAYHEEQLDGVRTRVISWGQEAQALKTAIALLEKVS